MGTLEQLKITHASNNKSRFKYGLSPRRKMINADNVKNEEKNA